MWLLTFCVLDVPPCLRPGKLSTLPPTIAASLLVTTQTVTNYAACTYLNASATLGRRIGFLAASFLRFVSAGSGSSARPSNSASSDVSGDSLPSRLLLAAVGDERWLLWGRLLLLRLADGERDLRLWVGGRYEARRWLLSLSRRGAVVLSAGWAPW